MSADDTKPSSRTNWDKLRDMDDAEIDYTDIPPLGDTFFSRAQLGLPYAVQIDPDVLRWFRQHNANYSEQINTILRQYIEATNRAA